VRPTRRTIWDLAEEAAREVARWPEWKRRVADWALVTPQRERTRADELELGATKAKTRA
jgi:hypothetical protein